MTCRCTVLSCLRTLLFGLCIVVSVEASAKSCFLSLFIDEEYRALVKIASVNKNRREELMSAPREQRPALAQRHLIEAIRYEEEKARIYISMLEKLLQQRADFLTTATEVKRRLIRSLDYYEVLREALSRVEGFESRAIDAPMSYRVASFLEE